MFNYVFIALINGAEIEINAKGVSEKSAMKKAWESLTDEQRNNCESLDCVEVLEV